MATPSVTTQAAVIPATAPPRPQQDVYAAQKANQQPSSNKGETGNITPPPPPRPTINTDGQTLGTLVNVTA